MSAFKTPIPIDIDGIKKLLPANAVIEKVLFDGKEVQVLWHSGRLTTPWTYPVEFTREQLENRKLPDRVSYMPEPTTAVPPPPVVPPAKVKPAIAPRVPRPPRAPRAPKAATLK